MNIFETLSQSDNATISILSGLVIILAGVVVVQWRYTINKTVPKWVWDNLVSKMEKMMKELATLHEQITILKERLK